MLIFLLPVPAVMLFHEKLSLQKEQNKNSASHPRAFEESLGNVTPVAVLKIQELRGEVTLGGRLTCILKGAAGWEKL